MKVLALFSLVAAIPPLEDKSLRGMSLEAPSLLQKGIDEWEYSQSCTISNIGNGTCDRDCFSGACKCDNWECNGSDCKKYFAAVGRPFRG